MRVAGADPGTSSLDLIVLDDGMVADQARFEPATLQADPDAPVKWLRDRGPFDLVAGPSGYGLPLVRSADCTDRDLALMALVRPDERGTAQGVFGFSAVARSFRDSGLPVVFLPGVIHLPTVPPHRKFNRIDLGTPDKLGVAALVLAQGETTFCLVELGSAFTACLLVIDGQVTDGLGGTSGPVGWGGGGAWDGELAYLLSPLMKADLFRGGAGTTANVTWYAESVRKAVASLRAVADFRKVILSGKMLDDHGAAVAAALGEYEVSRLVSLQDARVKHAAQGAAVVADGLAGGRFASVVERLQLRDASGTVLDWVVHPRGEKARRPFQ